MVCLAATADIQDDVCGQLLLSATVTVTAVDQQGVVQMGASTAGVKATRATGTLDA